MPYNPGVTNQSGELLARSIQAGKSNLIQALMWGSQQAEETSSLRKQADILDPLGKDRHAKQSKGELQGEIVGLHTKDQMQTAALNNALTQGQVNRLSNEAGNETAFTSALTSALPAPTTTTTDLQGNPAAGGNPFTVNVRSQAPVTPNALVTAIARYPGAANSTAGREVLNDWMRQSGGVQGGPPAFTQGPDGTTWAYNQKTGQFEPSPLDKIAATAKAKAAAKVPTRGPGEGPLVKKTPFGTMYFDTHLDAWKPLSGNHPDLFGTGDVAQDPAAGGAGVNYSWQNGELKLVK